MSLNLDRDESILGQMTLNLEVSLHSKFTDYLFISRYLIATTILSLVS